MKYFPNKIIKYCSNFKCDEIIKQDNTFTVFVILFLKIKLHSSLIYEYNIRTEMYKLI